MPQMETDELLIDLSALGCEPAEEYHAKSSRYLSSHGLIDYMECPRLFQMKQLGLVPEEDALALFLGAAAHCRILEGRDAYEARYALGGPINKAKGKPFGEDTNAFRDWAAAQGKPGIHFKHLDLIENLAAGVASNDGAVDLICDGRAEGVVRADYCGTPSQIRIDWANPRRGIVDLKTTADIKWFENECQRRRYHHQAAFYQAVLAQVIGRFVPVYLIAVEKKHPFRCGWWRVGDNTLANARKENEAAIGRLLLSWENDDFPTGYEEMRVLEFT